jgi:hypothetical protein
MDDPRLDLDLADGDRRICINVHKIEEELKMVTLEAMNQLFIT